MSFTLPVPVGNDGCYFKFTFPPDLPIFYLDKAPIIYQVNNVISYWNSLMGRGDTITIPNNNIFLDRIQYENGGYFIVEGCRNPTIVGAN